MKKWLYFVFPLVGVIIFVFFYVSHVEEAEKLMAVRKAEAVRVAKEEADKKSALEARARADAAQKAQERAAAEAKKEGERLAKWKDQGDKIQAETDEAINNSSNYTSTINKAEKERRELLSRKDKLNKELVESARKLELAKIERRNAEMEIQRVTEMILRKADASALAQPPVVVVPVAK